MSHDKVKAAARQRMARTGESYAVARSAVIREYQEAQQRACSLETARSKVYEGLAAELVGYGKHVRAKLTYSSGLAEIRRRFAAQYAELAGIGKIQQQFAAQTAEIAGIGRVQQQVAAQMAQTLRDAGVGKIQQQFAAQIAEIAGIGRVQQQVAAQAAEIVKAARMWSAFM